jgi:hypothetical protein
MQTKITLLFLITFPFILAFNVSGYGQFLLQIPLNSENNPDIMESLKLPVIFQSNNFIISYVSEQQLLDMSANNLKYQILDKSETLEEYFILSNKQNKFMTPDPSWGKILYQAEKFILVKNLSVSKEVLYDQRYDISHFSKNFSTFRNESIIPAVSQITTNNVIIDQLVNEINADSVRFFMQRLQDFQTRFLAVNNRDSIANWLKGQFEQMGYADVQLDSFQCYTFINLPYIVLDTTTQQKNVICTLPGNLYPDKVYIIGGHYDSFTRIDPWVFAPGADDNASGTAAVLEVARAMKAINFQPEATIKFIAFGAEELMLFGDGGSEHYAQQASSAGMDIKLMINNDMISHTFEPLNNSRLNVGYYTGFEYYRDLAMHLTDLYTVIIPEIGRVNMGGDSDSFYQFGYPAIYLMESDWSPFYHMPGDSLGNYDIDYCAEVIKTSGATLLFAMVTPTIVNDFQVLDCGNGDSLQLNWTPNTEPDLAGYHIHLGLQSGIYDTVFTTTDTSLILDYLVEGTEYFIGISAFDQDGNESMIVERTGIPYSIPLIPDNFRDNPVMYAIELHWSPNFELDLAGYNLYRSDDLAGSFQQLNANLIQDSLFVDQNVQFGPYYYYFVKAVDTLLNESLASDTVDSRAVSFDHGILVVDETADGNGSLGHPTDQQVDSFYTAILEDFTISHCDLNESGSLKLADLGVYSSVIWHGNDLDDFSKALLNQNALKSYLDVGGNLLISSYMPTESFGNNQTYPNQFNSGEFLFDYLKISNVEYHPPSRFNGAIPAMPGYDSIFVDTAKTFPHLNYHLLKIEGINAAANADIIFNYHSDYPSGSSFGMMGGLPVGIEYLGSDFRMILLGFPLYNMQLDQARALISHILINKFSEMVTVESMEQEIPSEFKLFQNYPNPFNPRTTITFEIPETAPVSLKIFNITGEEVATLIAGRLPVGRYSIDWDAGNLASGVYLYRLRVHSFDISNGKQAEIRKMILIK